MTGRRRLSFTALTRRMTRELGPEFDDLITSALWHASVIDDRENRLPDRQRAEVVWREQLAAIAARTAEQSRRETGAWGVSGLQAV